MTKQKQLAKLKSDYLALAAKLKEAYRMRREQPPRQSPVVSGFVRGLTGDNAKSI